jgi:uncharacterized membrane protein YiaA
MLFLHELKFNITHMSKWYWLFILLTTIGHGIAALLTYIEVGGNVAVECNGNATFLMNLIGMPALLIGSTILLFLLTLWGAESDYKKHGDSPSKLIMITLACVAFVCMLDAINDLASFFELTVLHSYTIGIILTVFKVLNLPISC